MVSASYGCTFVADALQTGTLIYILLQSRTGFKRRVNLRARARYQSSLFNRRTDNIVETLALYTTNTGMFSSLLGYGITHLNTDAGLLTRSVPNMLSDFPEKH